ncbi:HEAT repeat domain-containing protein [Wenzhouxiangella marina]|uniref:Uncharacterized protein n=1 Tax=Wenzhouxiangella marina TaxID=1579979 RepID=A0A0K0XV77_9GAMM|nr:HEAT repeat domain-containing protein [Wenzhouxiangella marina]AKS41583.1 hypothetical protein WM2015_1209 [Wenzhouxiangella marina]MBB6086658.1 hypothetical protein [Wenzhouxiangella marina]
MAGTLGRLIAFVLTLALVSSGTIEATSKQIGRKFRSAEPPADGLARALDLLERLEETEQGNAWPTLAGFLRLGPSAKQADKRLMEIAERRPDIMQDMLRVLLAIRSPLAAQLVNEEILQALESDASQEHLPFGFFTARSLSAIGREAVAAEPALIEVLRRSVHRESRLLAARTLGFIGSPASLSALLEALDSPSDVVLNWNAAHALGRIADLGALNALEAAATDHWYPPVRQAAAQAIQSLNGASVYVPLRRDVYDWAIDFNSNEAIGSEIEPCDLWPDSETAIIKTPFIAKDPHDIVKVPGLHLEIRNHPEDQLERPVAPRFVVPVEGGWLGGSDRGEWGGELVYFDENGDQKILLWAGVRFIHRFGSAFIALVQEYSDHGAVFRLSRNSRGHWVARFWRGLPGRPRWSWQEDSGDLIIHTSAGRIGLDEAGRMRMANCEE